MTLPMFYALDENRNVVESTTFDPESWQIANRRVGLDTVDGIEVSTVFLGSRHYPDDFFETMIFRQDDCEVVARYATWAEAEKGHAKVVASLKTE